MYEKIIKNNIMYLNNSITKNFLIKRQIDATDDEIEIITTLLKNNWQKLYNKDYQDTFKILKEKVSSKTYNAILTLYLDSVNKYL